MSCEVVANKPITLQCFAFVKCEHRLLVRGYFKYTSRSYFSLLFICSGKSMFYKSILYKSMFYKFVFYKSMFYKSMFYKSMFYKSMFYKSMFYKSMFYRSIFYKSILYKSIFTSLCFQGRSQGGARGGDRPFRTALSLASPPPPPPKMKVWLRHCMFYSPCFTSPCFTSSTIVQVHVLQDYVLQACFTRPYFTSLVHSLQVQSSRRSSPCFTTCRCYHVNKTGCNTCKSNGATNGSCTSNGTFNIINALYH